MDGPTPLILAVARAASAAPMDEEKIREHEDGKENPIANAEHMEEKNDDGKRDVTDAATPELHHSATNSSAVTTLQEASVLVGGGAATALQCIERLLEGGADINFNAPTRIPSFYSSPPCSSSSIAALAPLALALQLHAMPVAHLLLREGADARPILREAHYDDMLMPLLSSIPPTRMAKLIGACACVTVV